MDRTGCPPRPLRLLWRSGVRLALHRSTGSASRVGTRTVAVDLAPATTATEHDALTALLAELGRQKLTLPEDPRRRRLRFRVQS